MSARKTYLVVTLMGLLTLQTFAQKKAYFIDGFHGGVWGHYPKGYTSYIVEQLKQHPDWKINLEIEPETWDHEKTDAPDAYQELKKFFENQSATSRVEYVSPAFGQSYLYTSSGESIIRQFAYGIKKVREHFPSAIFTTYSSEEPCFTSALPQILTSFGYKYASLKNPNTLWGGYTRNFGGELVNWIGPDGSGIVTVPRYEVELLKPGSTWETIGNANSPKYINAALAYGIQNPLGMCLQDAGWRYGPWLKGGYYKPTVYTTWSNYFDNIANKNLAKDWKFSQEDLMPGLVWGAQVLQTLAQQIRVSENKIVQAEKMASLAKVYNGLPYPVKQIDKAWRPLLLAQHHDCWIVPYNGKKGDTWADKVVLWTDTTNTLSDEVIFNSVSSFSKPTTRPVSAVRVFNTAGVERTEWVTVTLPKSLNAAETIVTDDNGKQIPSQRVHNSKAGNNALLFKANVAPFGYRTYKLAKGTAALKGAKAERLGNGLYRAASDLYIVTVDPKKGGVITSLIAKQLNNKEFVAQTGERKFNELRGNFYKLGGFKSSADSAAKVSIIEEGPARVSLKIEGSIAGSPFTQIIALAQGQRRIDMSVKIDWKGSPGIGEYDENGRKSAVGRTAFYNDSYKLLALFPLNLKKQRAFVEAPFDVTASKLPNTFYNRWDSIKNNVMLNWVDFFDEQSNYGCALFTDHTTSYTHGENFPAGFNVQYAGKGLWGRDYRITHPTKISYALVPHKGQWNEAGVYSESLHNNEPLLAFAIAEDESAENSRSLIKSMKKGWEISSANIEGDDLYLRIFNGEGNGEAGELRLNVASADVQQVELNGALKAKLEFKNGSVANLAIPQFGFRTLKISNIAMSN